MNKNRLPISIIIPIYNEAENIFSLNKQILNVTTEMPEYSWEIIYVNDASTDGSVKVIQRIMKSSSLVSYIHFYSRQGKALALKAGFEKAKGEYIVTIDGDLQDDPAEIPKLLNKLKEGYDLVSGWKKTRKDSFIKVSTSKIFNYVTGKVTQVTMQDMNSGIKAYKSEVTNYIPLYGDLHRFIPVFAHYHGFRVAEIPVNHRKRASGKTKYGNSRFIGGFLDLISVMYLTKYRFQPLHLFGYLAIFVFGAGFLIGLYLVFIKYFTGTSIGERPLLLFSVLLMIIGVQIGVVGLIAEHITSTQLNRLSTDSIIRKKEFN